MRYQLQEKDYLDLWKYFQDKAISVKGAAFNTTTWVLGFAAAILGFIIPNLAGNDRGTGGIPISLLIYVLSLAGLGICLYAWFALNESSERIRDYLESRDNCAEKITGLENVVKRKEEERVQSDIFPEVRTVKRLRIAIWVFSVVFVAIIFSLCVRQIW